MNRKHIHIHTHSLDHVGDSVDEEQGGVFPTFELDHGIVSTGQHCSHHQMRVCFTTEQPQANFFLKSFLGATSSPRSLHQLILTLLGTWYIPFRNTSNWGLGRNLKVTLSLITWTVSPQWLSRSLLDLGPLGPKTCYDMAFCRYPDQTSSLSARRCVNLCYPLVI